MHRSRVSTILIDAPAAEAETAAGFWSAALGVPVSEIGNTLGALVGGAPISKFVDHPSMLSQILP